MSLIFIFRTILFLQYKFSRICASLQIFFLQITFVDVYEMLWIISTDNIGICSQLACFVGHSLFD